MLEYAKDYSVGRGTDAPFEQIGAEWIHGAELARFLNERSIPGVRAYATRFTPASAPLKDRPLEGVRFVVMNREQFSSVRLGLEFAYALGKLYPGKIDFETCRKLIGNRKIIDAMKSGDDPRAIEQKIEEDLRTSKSADALTFFTNGKRTSPRTVLPGRTRRAPETTIMCEFRGPFPTDRSANRGQMRCCDLIAAPNCFTGS